MAMSGVTIEHTVPEQIAHIACRRLVCFPDAGIRKKTKVIDRDPLRLTVIDNTKQDNVGKREKECQACTVENADSFQPC